MAFKIIWDDSLELLALAMFSSAESKEDPFETECTVVGSPVMAGWLKQYFLYDFPRKQKKQPVLACWDFKMLHPFVNDWLAKACQGIPVGQRDPAQHPYSHGVLQWRILKILAEAAENNAYETLRAYFAGQDPIAADRKRWGLAARLAQLFDDYQNFRPDLLKEWQEDRNTGLITGQEWQAELWRALVSQNADTYLKQFQDMAGKLGDCGIKEAYKRITVFHTSAMPRAYMQFFVELGKIMDVGMFIFNPSKEFWLDDPAVKNHIINLKDSPDDPAWMTPPHPILSGFGRGTQAFLATVLDVTDGNVGDFPNRSENGRQTLLSKIQADIREKGESAIKDAKDDGSIQFHVCHGPLRETEVAKDLILKWFEENPGSQPRDVQVLVPDMETYAPFIESVFRVHDHTPAIPCSISQRPPVSGGAVGAAFMKLTRLHESRMTATEVVELLELDPVRERYRLDAEDLSELRALVNEAGIRWGRDGRHLDNILKSGVQTDSKDKSHDTVTWRRGLDRLLAGFALGRCDQGDEVVEAGALGSLKLCDSVEGHTAVLTGKLAEFFDDLCEAADNLGQGARKKVSAWTDGYFSMLERFFRGTETSYIELAEIRRGIRAVGQAGRKAGDPEASADVMAAAIEAHLGGMAPAGKTDINAVLFSPLRTMHVTPRKLTIMLGLNEDVFPRADQRPAFDLLAVKPRYGDRSMRHEDRLAFLEAIMSTRERMIITYTGRNISNNKEIPPSPAVTEFQQYIESCSKDRGENGRAEPLIGRVEHKLHGFNPEYYRQNSKLFSYSQSNYAGASALCPNETATDTRQAPQPAAETGSETADDAEPAVKNSVTLKELQEFFVNPAKIFFNRILQVWLSDPARDNLSDSEIFDGDALDEYKINAVMLEDILGKSASEKEKADFDADAPYWERLQEQSLIPLGTYGLARTKQPFFKLREFLNETKGYSSHANLYRALLDLRGRERDPTAVAVEVGTRIVNGALPVIIQEDRTFLLRFRYANIKAKDRVRAWVAHVVGHAAGNSFHTDIIAKGKSRETISPLSQAAAEEILGKMLDLFEKGNSALLPFAPASSHAYAEGILTRPSQPAAAGAADRQTRNMAEQGAADAWSKDPERGEFKDVYLYEAWGEDGPVTHSEFGECAMRFWEKFIVPPAVDGAVGPTGQEETHV